MTGICTIANQDKAQEWKEKLHRLHKRFLFRKFYLHRPTFSLAEYHEDYLIVAVLVRDGVDSSLVEALGTLIFIVVGVACSSILERHQFLAEGQ